MKTLASLRVLCVDDQRFMLKTLETLLKRLGVVRISGCSDPMEAINLLSKSKFDLMFTDLQMDQLNGLELIKRVRSGQTPSPRDMPIIVASGLAEAHIIKKAWLLDATDFILKPIKLTSVEEKVRRVLKRKYAIKDPEDYLQVNTSLVMTNLHEQEETQGEAKPQVQTGSISRKDCPLHAIPEGAILETPIYTSDGGLFMEVGAVLTKAVIERIYSNAQLTGMRSLDVRVEISETE